MSHQVAHKRVKSHRRRDEETVLRGEPANSQQASGEEQHRPGKFRNVKVVTEEKRARGNVIGLMPNISVFQVTDLNNHDIKTNLCT